MPSDIHSYSIIILLEYHSKFYLKVSYCRNFSKQFIGTAFKYCIEQDFEIIDEYQTITVRSNELFLNEILHCIKVAIKRFLLVIDTNVEVKERKEILGNFCLYVLYRRLIHRNVIPEEKILTLLWKLQKKIPCVIICQNSVWNLGLKIFFFYDSYYHYFASVCTTYFSLNEITKSILHMHTNT